MIQDSEDSLPCNYQHNLIPPPLCQQTCDDWVDSIKEITNDPAVCSSSLQRNTTLASLSLQCVSWQGFNGTGDTNCVSGIANEPENCGFQGNVPGACHYCTNHRSDTCCAAVHGCKHPLAPGAIAGIAVGCVVFSLIVLASLLYLCIRKRRTPSHFSSPELGPDHSLERREDVSTSQQALVHSASAGVVPPDLPIHNMPPMEERSTISPVQPLTLNAFHIVVHPYPPQVDDELSLSIGDIVCLALSFDDGWALGFNITSGRKGVFPTVCIAPAPQDLLNRLMLMPENPNSYSKIQWEDTSSNLPDMEEYHIQQRDASNHPQKDAVLTMERLHENLQRSISLGLFSKPIARSSLVYTHTMPSKKTRRTSYSSDSENPTSPSHALYSIPYSASQSTPKDSYELQDHNTSTTNMTSLHPSSHTSNDVRSKRRET
ncbi:hypothetical protein F4703DRAFT_1730079 [Phycomyces blakesleeanus]